MVGNRLKTGISSLAIEDRLQYNPEIIEFFLNTQSLEDIEELRSKIRYVKSKGIKVYLHHPAKLNGKYLDILSKDPAMKEYYTWSSKVLAQLCKEEDIRCVIHCHYAGSESSEEITLEKTLEMKEEISKILEFGREVFLWEDTIEGLFAHTNPYLFEHVIQPLQLDLNLDISHSYIATKGNNEELLSIVKRTAPYVKYLHVVDSLGQEHDGRELGEGSINWLPLKPYIEGKDFVFEILLKDINDCLPMVRSAEYFNGLTSIKQLL
ncbi:sugar phosphate isomerase/epimerase [Priestia filamentosa]|uniref:sugar phosphate isomerase/epimerase n=1 Tax=Priestia filamentosa TaxID=1402861 RepID=UPI0039789510